MNKKVAIVEDNPDNLVLVQALLGDRYDIVAYEDSFEALNQLKVEQPDVVLMDISMPILDGIELLHKLKKDERTKDIPIIALTAHAMEGDREKYIALGFDDYLTKPIFDENLLFQVLESNLEK